VRVLVLLLASVLMMGLMTGTVAQTACASPDVVGAVEPAPDADPPVMPDLAMPEPGDRGPDRSALPTAPTRGRMHAVLVFRPPRPVTSR
jgi:hypothetical protein